MHIKIGIFKTKQFGLETYEIRVNGVVHHTFLSLAQARSRMLQLVSKTAIQG